MERQIHITKLNAKYNKDFDTFGKMDPFLIFKIGKTQAKTETANSQGKTPTWNAEIIMTYLDQSTMNITSYDEDTMSNDFMGVGTLDLKKLKTSGLLQIKIQDKGQLIGTVFGQYTVKTLPPTPLLIIKNIKCDFFKQTKFILKAKPYFSLSCGTHNMVTEVSQEPSGKKLSWNETLRVKIKETNPITFSLLDKDDNGSQIFKYQSKIDEFKITSGKKQFYVHDKTFEPLGIVQFEFETLNLVNRQQSTKNEEKKKQQQNQMTKITIAKIRGNLLKDNIDVYFKILCGPNMVLTNSINSAPKNFQMNEKIPFYAQSKENKITFALWDKNLLSDDIVGVGYLSLPTTAGQKQVQLKNRTGDSKGSIFVTVQVQKITAKSICFQQIKLDMLQKGDLIGSSQPYIIGRIGGWSCRTQTAEGQKVTFKKSLNLKFHDEETAIFQVWDEDITSHDKLFSQSVSMSNFKKKNGEITVPLGNKKGQIKMKFTTKNFEQANTVDSPLKKPIENKKQKQSKKQLQTLAKQEIKLQHQPAPQNNQKIVNERQKISNIPNIQKEKKENTVDVQSIDQSSINKSRNTIKLPSIQNKNFGDKIFDKQSSSTLQKSIHVYSIPKATRFGNGQKYAGEPSYYVETSFKPNSGRGVGFGFGNKRQFPQWLQKNMKQIPAPSAYFQGRPGHLTEGYNRSKGPTFGIGHKYYEKVMIPKQKSLTRNSIQRIRRTNDQK